MAWNRACNSEARDASMNAGNVRLRWGVAALIAIAGMSVVCLFCFRADNSSSQAPHRVKSTGIKTVPPTGLSTNVVHKDYASLSHWDLRHLSVGETNSLTAEQLREWKMFNPWPPPDKNQRKHARAKWEIFEKHVDNEIACLLSIEPGTSFYGDGSLFRNFDKRFIRSLKSPIIVLESDSDYVKQLKRAVNEAKADLKAQYDAGEDINRIMLETREELQRLGRYRQEIEAMALKEVNKAGVTAKDAELTLAAVNQMLESKGIAPIKANSMSRISMRLRALEAREKLKGESKQ